MVVGRGPAGLLLSSLAVQEGATLTIVADGQSTLPLWGGQWDFRNYDDQGAPITDPYAWWQKFHARTPSLGHPAAWLGRWRHLAELWNDMGIGVDLPPAENHWTVTPLGHLRPTYLSPAWQHTVVKPGPATFVGVPGLLDFSPAAMARVYEWATGVTAHFMTLDVPAQWREGWNALNWAWFLDSSVGQTWLTRTLREVALPAEGPLLFPQILGVEQCADLIAQLTQVLERPVAEVPLPPPAVGGIRVQQRWDRWLRHHGVRFVSGHVRGAEAGAVWLADGRRLEGRVALATGGVLGGGLAVDIDGMVRDVVTDVVVASRMEDFATVGHPDPHGLIPVVGRMVQGWNPDQYGEGGAMVLWSVHEVYHALTGQSVAVGEER